LPEIITRLSLPARRYHEPFLGGGAIFFGLEATGLVRAATLNDLNRDLVATYETVRDAPEELIAALATLEREYLQSEPSRRPAVYYEIRERAPADHVSTAARLIFLNRTCYNGLYRVNRRGQFNVPHGDYANPRILDAAALRAASKALTSAELISEDFGDACERAQPGDLVYLDPPYQPLSATASFTNYTSTDFGPEEQVRLSESFRRLTRRGIAALLSNSAHPFIVDLYPGYEVSRVPMRRAINSVGHKRGAVEELLVSNLPLVGYHFSSSPK
jgi:DNA adenine methylase